MFNSFFFTQKTAYEMRMSDWSSDVCSSDLIPAVMESDSDLRRRLVLAPEGYSVAGPEGAYIFHALSAHPDVLDASAIRSEERSVGKECVSPGRSRWSPLH